MKLRIRMLTEEYGETLNAYLQGDAEEVIDGLIDLCAIAIGTLDIAGVLGSTIVQPIVYSEFSMHILNICYPVHYSILWFSNHAPYIAQ